MKSVCGHIKELIMVQPRQKDTTHKKSTKVGSLVTVPSETCDGCCFEVFDFEDVDSVGGDLRICEFIRCNSNERKNTPHVIFKIE